MLRAHGHSTCLVGKMHFVGPDQLHGFEERLTTDIYPADLNWTPDWRVPTSERLPWYHTMESVMRPGVTTASMQQDYDDEVAFHAVRKLHDLARSDPDRPFFLCVSFTHPHDPWELRARYWDRYDPDAIEGPAVSGVAQDPHSRRLRAMCGADEVEPSEEEVRRARHGYYAAISYLDERVGEVLGALRDTGLDDGTTIVFTADHGELLGEHGLWYKMSFRDPAARVPLIVRTPGGGRAGQIVSAPVAGVDLAPTLVELAGADAELDGDGESLVPLLFGGSRATPVCAEYLAEGVTRPAVMLRRGRHKLTVCPGDPDLLFDLDADPHELDDLAGLHPVHDELRAEVERARWDLDALEKQVLASQAERRLVVRALDRGAFTPWDFSPDTDGAHRYVRTRVDLYQLQRRARLDAVPDQQGA